MTDAVVPDPRLRPVLSVEEAGRILGLGRSAAYDAAKRGDIPTIRFGRRLMVPTAGLRKRLEID
jgi:excisionase family DNA binding protein